MKNKTSRTLDLELEDDQLVIAEYIPVQEEGVVKQREVSWLAGGEDEEGEDTFDWLAEASDKTYFIFANEMREPMKAGTQAWNCYGNRTNEYLLVNYGFCF